MKTKTIKRTRPYLCTVCGGNGADPRSRAGSCLECDGTGILQIEELETWDDSDQLGSDAGKEPTYDCAGAREGLFGKPLDLANPKASTMEEIAEALTKVHPDCQFYVVKQEDGTSALGYKFDATGGVSTLEVIEAEEKCAYLMTNYCADVDGTCDHVEAGDFQKCERYKP